jgi:hypothetical protein
MAEHDGYTINVGDILWVRFDVGNEATWPPVGKLVLVYEGSGYYCTESLSTEFGIAWYDENSDFNDGWEPADERWWRALPPPPAGFDSPAYVPAEGADAADSWRV